MWSLRDGSLGKCPVRMWCAQVPARGSILMRMPRRESPQATHRSPLVPLNPSRQTIWPPGLRVVGPVTQRMPAWSRSAPEPPAEPQKTPNASAHHLGFAQSRLTSLSGRRGLWEWLQRLSRAQIPQIWEKVTTMATHPYLGLAAR